MCKLSLRKNIVKKLIFLSQHHLYCLILKSLMSDLSISVPNNIINPTDTVIFKIQKTPAPKPESPKFRSFRFPTKSQNTIILIYNKEFSITLLYDLLREHGMEQITPVIVMPP